MKEISLEESIRKSAELNRGLILPDGGRTSRKWPLCMTCNKEVEAAEIVNVNTKSCEIRAICNHDGKDVEDFYKVYWKVPLSKSDVDLLDDVNVGWAIARAVADGCFFDPKHNWDFSSKRR